MEQVPSGQEAPVASSWSGASVAPALWAFPGGLRSGAVASGLKAENGRFGGLTGR